MHPMCATVATNSFSMEPDTIVSARFSNSCRVDRKRDQADDDLVSETIQVAASDPKKRVQRTSEEKRRIVEATLVPDASIARVARENGVHANRVFQWRYEYRNDTGWAVNPRAKLLPVTVIAEPSSIVMPEVASIPTPAPSSASIHIELPCRVLVSVETGVDPELVRVVLGSPLR